jgi:ribosomal protein S18 acetylase RimI-like enzyme
MELPTTSSSKLADRSRSPLMLVRKRQAQLVNYDVATTSDSGDIICLIAKVFSESEPPAVAMALSFADLEQFLHLIVPSVIPGGLTVISRSVPTGGLAGVLLTDDFRTPPAMDLTRISHKFLPILSMLDTLDEHYCKGRTISPGKYLHLFMLAVDRQFAGHGVGQRLVRACIENGSRKGYRTALAEATGKVSQHIFRKNGFADRFRVPYRDFKYEDRAVFASIGEHEEAILMDRALT